MQYFEKWFEWHNGAVVSSVSSQHVGPIFKFTSPAGSLWILSRYSSFSPQCKHMHVRLTAHSILAIDAKVGIAVHLSGLNMWQTGILSSHLLCYDIWESLQLSWNPASDKKKKMDVKLKIVQSLDWENVFRSFHLFYDRNSYNVREK